MSLFLGKFSMNRPDQVEGKYYQGGSEGSIWYGDLQLGDYVFPSHNGFIIGLWQAKAFNTILINGVKCEVLEFDEIKKYNDVNVSKDFARYKHFIHDLNLVNKITKSVKNLGFIPIQETENCPIAESIEFNDNIINVYIALKDLERNYLEGDIRVTIDNLDKTNIISIEKYVDSKFELYENFHDLYQSKCEEKGKFSLKELLAYSVEDNASQKRKFLTTLLSELNDSGFMRVSSPIKLYDMVLVGRKVYTKAGIHNTDTTCVLPDDNYYSQYAELLDFNPNLILYGPPGTGKTFATEKIVSAYERLNYSKESSYENASNEGRVRNITFHQSFSYEEFIEGIRPNLGEESTKLSYVLENGVFKEHCLNAEKEILKRNDNADYIDLINSNSAIWKVSLGDRRYDDVYNECIKSEDIAISWLNDVNLMDLEYDDIYNQLGSSEYGEKPTQNANTIFSFVYEMNVGDIVIIFDSLKTTRMIGIIKDDYRHDSSYNDYCHRRSVKWFDSLDYPINIHKHNGNVNLSLKTIYKLNRISVSNIVEIVSENSKESTIVESKNQIKPYYFVIDEINRGNIAKIFGELITLIEQDKRGKTDVYLPYSKKAFNVPSNIYLIGTMNTADRSLAAIDTALRRRFTFVEIEPDSNILAINDNSVVNDTVDLIKLMDVLNDSILEHFDRDHRIGHAYFMGIESLKDLYHTWYYKILPLLSDYFYSDIETLQILVGKAFYDDYGNVKYLDKKQTGNQISEFEVALIKLYSE